MKIIFLLCFLSSVCLACPKNSVEINDACAALPSPQESALAPDINIASDEKPPRHQEPEWETGAVRADAGVPAVEDSTDVAHDYAAERDQK